MAQVEEVVGLQEHVAELGVGDAVFALDPRPDRFLGDHLVHRDVLADVAEKVEHPHGGRPVGIVDQRGRERARLEVEDALQLALDAGDVVAQGLPVEQVALLAAPPGSPTMPVAPPASGNGRWPAS
jgi:hypothetical protein